MYPRTTRRLRSAPGAMVTMFASGRKSVARLRLPMELWRRRSAVPRSFRRVQDLEVGNPPALEAHVVRQHAEPLALDLAGAPQLVTRAHRLAAAPVWERRKNEPVAMAISLDQQHACADRVEPHRL